VSDTGFQPDEGRPTEVVVERPRYLIALAVTAVVAILFLVFIFQNSEAVEVSWLWLDGEVTLWHILLLTAAASVVIERVGLYFARRSIRRRRDRARR
jgi:uncharacterized integral membrane protein